MMERVKEKRFRKRDRQKQKRTGSVPSGSKIRYLVWSLSLRSMLQGYVIRFIFLNQNFIDAGSVHVDDFESEA